MTKEQAYSVIVQVVNAHMCNKADRVVLDQALQVFAQLVEESLKKTEK